MIKNTEEMDSRVLMFKLSRSFCSYSHYKPNKVFIVVVFDLKGKIMYQQGKFLDYKRDKLEKVSRSLLPKIMKDVRINPYTV